MSGGHFDYMQYQLQDLTHALKEEINASDTQLNEELKTHLKRTIHNLEEAFIYVHRIDWYISGDTSKDLCDLRIEQDLKALKEQEEQNEHL